MAAPVLRAEDLLAETLADYDLDAAALGLGAPQSDEEAEARALAKVLFARPERRDSAGARVGTTLAQVDKEIAAWLQMIAAGGPAPSGKPPHPHTAPSHAPRARVRLGVADPATTDNLRIYLPAALPAREGTDAAAHRTADLAVYRGMSLVQLGLIELDLLRERALLAELHDDFVLRSCYHLLAARVVLRTWSERFPGVARELAAVPTLLRSPDLRVGAVSVRPESIPEILAPLYDGWVPPDARGTPGLAGAPRDAQLNEVAGVLASVARFETAGPTLALLPARLLGAARTLRALCLRARTGPPPIPSWLGVIRPAWILRDLARDLAYENAWMAGNAPLRQLAEAQARNGAGGTGPRDGPTAPPPPVPATGLRARLLARLRGPSVAERPAYGPLRDARDPSGPGPASGDPARRPGEALRRGAGPPPSPESEAPPADVDPRSRDWDEWDAESGTWRHAHVRVEETDAPAGGIDRWERLVLANARQLSMVRARFEALRVEERWIHGQVDGSELDLPRVVDAVTDLAAGHTPDGRIYARFVRQRETLATLVLVDCSGSTAGNVLAMETEALVLLAAGLDALRAPHAFYAFGNPDPLRLPLARIKGFDDVWDDAAHKRLGNLRAQGASRLGAYLRHAGWMLGQRPQARRVLLVLTDGRPEDRDGYRGTQGLVDTALAVQEVRRAGIHVHAVSLDASEHADRYLLQVFGRGRATRLPSPDALPTRLPEIFRALVR